MVPCASSPPSLLPAWNFDSSANTHQQAVSHRGNEHRGLGGNDRAGAPEARGPRRGTGRAGSSPHPRPTRPRRAPRGPGPEDTAAPTVPGTACRDTPLGPSRHSCVRLAARRINPRQSHATTRSVSSRKEEQGWRRCFEPRPGPRRPSRPRRRYPCGRLEIKSHRNQSYRRTRRVRRRMAHGAWRESAREMRNWCLCAECRNGEGVRLATAITGGACTRWSAPSSARPARRG